MIGVKSVSVRSDSPQNKCLFAAINTQECKICDSCLGAEACRATDAGEIGGQGGGRPCCAKGGQAEKERR